MLKEKFREQLCIRDNTRKVSMPKFKAVSFFSSTGVIDVFYNFLFLCKSEIVFTYLKLIFDKFPKYVYNMIFN